MDQQWRGLWNAGRIQMQLATRAVVYLVTPLALALLFGHLSSLSALASGYLGSFIVGTSITVWFEILYSFVWPYVLRRKPRWPARIAGHVATVVVAVGIGGFVASAIGHALFGWAQTLPRLWVQSAVISCVILGILITTDELGARASALERREAQHRLAVVRAELSALQARTDPHFLFNSLNTVAALIPDDPALAESLLERLAAVFRYALDAGRRDSVELAEELEAVSAYLEVEALRLGSRLSWKLDRTGDIANIRVPPLVLQPLVENAIKHGAGGRLGATAVQVTVRRSGDELMLVVEDRGDETAAAVGGGSGTSLADLRARLALAYAGRARLDSSAISPTTWRTEVVVPVER